LAQHFLQKHCRENNKSITAIADETLALLQKYRWPGNIRELGNIIERAALICQEDTLLPSHLFFDEEELEADRPSGTSPALLKGTIHEMEKELIYQTLDETGGNKTRAAGNLGISIRTLRNKLNEYKEKKFQ
jgi:DNA-binding NtrC family response regulator